MKGLCTKTFLKGLMEYSCTPNPHTFFGVRMTSAEVDMFNTYGKYLFLKGHLFLNKFLM